MCLANVSDSLDVIRAMPDVASSTELQSFLLQFKEREEQLRKESNANKNIQVQNARWT